MTPMPAHSTGILTGPEIRAAVDLGLIEIDPFDAKQVNPASYDLRLGDEVTVYRNWVDTRVERSQDDSLYDGSRLYPWRDGALDVKNEPNTVSFKIHRGGWLLKPDIGYLMHTAERVCTKKYVPVLDGKSSLGRLFVQVHATAGYGDAGFNGQYTLEVTVKHPIRVYAGMLFAQIRFHTMQGEVQLYEGNYTGAAAKGAVPSRAWRQFR